MPISCPIAFGSLSKTEYDELDRRVLSHAYDCQNDLGKFYDERVYEADLKTRLAKDGIQAHTQTPVLVTHMDFVKPYRLDLVVNNTSLYDLKAVSTFTSDHVAQLINYIHLLGLRRGKLLNFRSARVQGRLVATGLTPEARYKIKVDDRRWRCVGPECKELKVLMMELLNDWGAFLEVNLYYEGLLHFLGGEAKVLQTVNVTREGLMLGRQAVPRHAPNVGFRLTAFPDSLPFHEKHLCRFIKYTDLKALQWNNMHQDEVAFITLE